MAETQARERLADEKPSESLTRSYFLPWEISIYLISVRPEVSKGKAHRDDSVAYGRSASIPQRERGVNRSSRLVNSSTGEARKTEMPETPRQRLCLPNLCWELAR